MLDLKKIPIVVGGYPNFVDEAWYEITEIGEWLEQDDNFDDDLDEDRVIRYNPWLNYTAPKPIILKEYIENEYVPYAVALQIPGKRFVFDLEGTVHRIVFGGERAGTTRIMTEEEYNTALQEMLAQISTVEDKEKYMELISRISYDSNVDWPTYIQYLIEKEEDKTWDSLTLIEESFDELMQNNPSQRYKFSHSYQDTHYIGRTARNIQRLEVKKQDGACSEISWYSNYRRYIFNLETGEYIVAGRGYTRPMYLDDFDKMLPEIMLKNQNTRDEEDKAFIENEMTKLSQARQNGELPLVHRTFEKVKK